MSTVGIFNIQDVQTGNAPVSVTSKNIAFAKPYVAPPQLPLGLNQLDIDRSANIRIKATATDITKTNFLAHVDSWSDTKLYSGGFTWFEQGPAFLEYQSGQFATTEDHPWNEPKKETSRRINFARPFVTPPKVIAFFNELDMAKDRNWRAKTYVSNIDEKGFTIHIDTWADTVLYSATAGWIAYPEDREYVFSASVNTMEVRPWDKPQLENHKAINFGFEFWKKPHVFIALNWLDIDQTANLRLKTTVDGVSQTGLTWHLDSWADTVLYSAGASILCVV